MIIFSSQIYKQKMPLCFLLHIPHHAESIQFLENFKYKQKMLISSTFAAHLVTNQSFLIELSFISIRSHIHTSRTLLNFALKPNNCSKNVKNKKYGRKKKLSGHENRKRKAEKEAAAVENSQSIRKFFGQGNDFCVKCSKIQVNLFFSREFRFDQFK